MATREALDSRFGQARAHCPANRCHPSDPPMQNSAACKEPTRVFRHDLEVAAGCLAPGRVLTSYPMDERLEVSWKRRSSRSGCPSPKQAKPLAMPADQCRRLHNGQRLPPIEPAGEPDQSYAGGMSGSSRCDVALLIQGQLLAQEEYQQRACEPSGAVERAHELSHSQGIPPKYRWLSLLIVAAGGRDVQSYENGIFAEHTRFTSANLPPVMCASGASVTPTIALLTPPGRVNRRVACAGII
jgi:hypothetical protein